MTRFRNKRNTFRVVVFTERGSRLKFETADDATQTVAEVVASIRKTADLIERTLLNPGGTAPQQPTAGTEAAGDAS